MAFNAYDVAKIITDYKTGWHEADKAGDRKKADEYAKNAQQYYQQLIDNGYSDVANVLKNTNDVGARSYLENLKKNTVPESSMPEAKDITTADGMINHTFNVQNTNMGDMKKKYDYIFDYNINNNPYESDVGKSILSRYQYQGKTASDNAVASGGASNGGNIDSYASANANRQQLAFTVAGDQAVQNYRNDVLTNARNFLNDMGTYLQNQEKGMQTTAGMKQTEEQRVFENDETSKNNDVSRKKTISEVTGFAPNEWVDANNEFLDDNGNLKAEYENVDFSAIMANAKKNGNTELYNQASVARAKKIFSNYAKYGKYDDGNYTLSGKQQTESGRQFDRGAELKEDEIKANERMNDATNTTNLQISNNELQANIAEAEEDKSWSEELKDADIKGDAKGFLDAYVYSYWANDEKSDIKSLLESNNANLAKYLEDPTNSSVQPFKITKNDASNILSWLDIDELYIGEDADGNKVYMPKEKWLDSQRWYDPTVDDAMIKKFLE